MNIDINFISNFISNSKPNEKDLNKAKSIIDYCCNVYYDSTDESPLTDEEYDKLYNHYKLFKGDISVLSTSNKRNKNLIDTEHLFPELVGTLDKCNYINKKDKENKDALSCEEWFKQLNIKDKPYSFNISLKHDGNSITLTINDQYKIVSALTRGKDGLGSDKTNYFKNFKIPKFIKIPKGSLLGIKCEAIMTYENKEKVCEMLNENYANPRSLVAGLLGRKDTPQEIINLINLVPIRIQLSNKKISRSKELELLRKLHTEYKEEFPYSINPEFYNKNEQGFKIQDITCTIKSFLKTVLPEFYYDINDNKRKILPYPIDGIVIEIVDEEIREQLGRNADRNNFEFALKFPYMVKKSKVKDIDFYVSTNGTGRITPVVIFKPLNFNGAICDHVSIANYKRFKELSLSKGDSVIIEYRNDVLSYLQKDTSKKSKNDPIKFPTKCPLCGEKLKINKNKTFVMCDNKNCDSIKIGKINHYLISIGVDSVRENIITDLYKNGLIKNIPSLYSLKASDIERLDGYQITSAKNIVNAINYKKDFYDWEVIGSLGFKNIALSTCKEIFKELNIEDLENRLNDKDAFITRLVEIKGIAEITAKQFYKDFNKNLKIINKLKSILNIKSYKDTIKVSAEPKNIVFTGFRNKDIQEKLELAGHSVKSSVSSKTDMLVCAVKGSGSEKEKKAQSLSIPIYTVDEFLSNIINTLL